MNRTAADASDGVQGEGRQVRTNPHGCGRFCGPESRRQGLRRRGTARLCRFPAAHRPQAAAGFAGTHLPSSGRLRRDTAAGGRYRSVPLAVQCRSAGAPDAQAWLSARIFHTAGKKGCTRAIRPSRRLAPPDSGTNLPVQELSNTKRVLTL